MTKKTSKEKLLAFLREKDDQLENQYLLEEDLQEVANWSEEVCAEVIAKICDDSDLCDINLCPWCILLFYSSGCRQCEYGARHGICLKDKSDYINLIEGNEAGLCTMLDIPKLMETLK